MLHTYGKNVLVYYRSYHIAPAQHHVEIGNKVTYVIAQIVRQSISCRQGTVY